MMEFAGGGAAGVRRGFLNRRIFSEEPLNKAERTLINSINSALDKLPSQTGTFYRGLGETPEWFDTKYAVEGRVFETHFTSVSRDLSTNYKQNKIMEFHSKHVKDISPLAMDVQFAKYINQPPAAAEFLIQANSKFRVLRIEGSRYILEDID